MQQKFTLLIFIALLLSACESEYNRGYNDGHEVGYKKGHKEGYEIGFSEGHDKGYWEGTQFLVENTLIPTAALSISIAIGLVIIGAVVGAFYKTWVSFFKEKWVARNTFKQLQELKESEIFRHNMDNKIRLEQFAKAKEAELANVIHTLELSEKLSDIIINSYPKVDESSDIHNLYLDIFKETKKSKDLSNKQKIGIYEDILSRAKKLNSESTTFESQNLVEQTQLK